MISMYIVLPKKNKEKNKQFVNNSLTRSVIYKHLYIFFNQLSRVLLFTDDAFGPISEFIVVIYDGCVIRSLLLLDFMFYLLGQ